MRRSCSDSLLTASQSDGVFGSDRVAEHGAEIGVDGSRVAFVGNSVGGDTAAALNVGLNEKDPGIFGVHHLPAWFTIPLAPVL
jgi:acetyl esterase/lipase